MLAVVVVLDKMHLEALVVLVAEETVIVLLVVVQEQVQLLVQQIEEVVLEEKLNPLELIKRHLVLLAVQVL